MPDVTVSIEEDGTRNVDLSDGLAEIGPELAEKWACSRLPDRTISEFRAVLKAGDFDVLAKGMIMVNASLKACASPASKPNGLPTQMLEFNMVWTSLKDLTNAKASQN